MKKIEIRIAGLGGQGVVLAGQILGKAAAYEGKNVVQTQSYGAEARGGAAKSEVIISDDKIGFPTVRKCDILIAMTQETIEKNINDLRENSILLIDSSNVRNIPETKARIFKIPATEIAEKFFGQKIYVNMVMLGALAEITGIVKGNSVELAIKGTVTEKALAINILAFQKGKEAASLK